MTSTIPIHRTFHRDTCIGAQHFHCKTCDLAVAVGKHDIEDGLDGYCLNHRPKR